MGLKPEAASGQIAILQCRKNQLQPLDLFSQLVTVPKQESLRFPSNSQNQAREMGFSEIGYAYEFSTAVHIARLTLPGVCEFICITFLSSLTALSHLRLPVHINFPLIVEYRKHLQATHEKLFSTTCSWKTCVGQTDTFVLIALHFFPSFTTVH